MFRPSQSKRVSLPSLANVGKTMDADGRDLVLTNGCFDIVHPGHVRYLEEARQLGDALAVALNSDDSVRRLKGANRPINGVEERALVVGALESVDFVCVFDDDTAEQIVATVRPAVYVKGGDYSASVDDPGFPPEGRIATSYGGRVH